MLRKLLLVCGGLLTAIGGMSLALGVQAGLSVLVFGALLLLATLFERWRYKPPVEQAKGQPTGERFVDTTTGELMEVWYDPATGERSYVKVDDRRLPPG